MAQAHSTDLRLSPARRSAFRASMRACVSLLGLTIGSTVLATSARAETSAPAVLPQAGRVLSGTADIASSAQAMTIAQAGQAAVIDWRSFDIGAGHQVRFVQPDAQAVTLNLVSGESASILAGSLTANGSIVLLNPNGIAITSTGTVDVGSGFAASTLALTGADERGRLQFRGSGNSAPVTNTGRITVGAQGFAALVGGSVANSGLITVPMGRITLAAGEAATIDTFGDGFLQIALGDRGAGLAGQPATLLQMSGSTAQAAWREVVSLSSDVAATTVHREGNAVVFGDAPAAGSVALSGRLDASSANAAGGAITVAGQSVNLAGAQLDVSGTTGGTIAVGGGALGQAVAGMAAARAARLDEGTLLNASGTAGSGGTVTVWGGDALDYRGHIVATGTGGDGGSAEVSGMGAYVYGGTTNLLSQGGRTGTLLLDPGTIIICHAGDAGCSGATSVAAIQGDASTTSTGYLQDTTLASALTSAAVSLAASAQITDSSSAVAVTTGSGGALTLTAPNITLSGSYGVNGGLTLSNTDATSSISGVISGSGGLTKSGVGTLTLSGANTYTGTTTVSGGTLAIGNGGSVTQSGTTTINNSGTLSVSGNFTTAPGAHFGVGMGSAGTAIVNSGGSLSVGNGSGATLIGGNTTNNGVYGVGTLTINGGTMTVGAAGSGGASYDAARLWLNAYGNATGYGMLNLNGGTLVLARSVGDGGAGYSAINFNGGTLQAGFSGQIINNNASNTINVRNGGLILNTNGYAVSIANILRHSTIGGDNAIDGGVTVQGAGTLTLSGANTYTGATTVSAGTLKAGSTSAFGSNSATTVASGATLDLAGNSLTLGSLAGAGTVTNSTSATTTTLTTGGLNTDTTFSGLIQNGAGTMALAVNGSGALALTGASTYSGGTSISGGNYTFIQNVAALGTGTVTVNAASGLGFWISGGGTVTNNFVINSAGATGNTSAGGSNLKSALFGDGATGAGATTLSGTVTLNHATSSVGSFYSGNAITISGQVTGSGGLALSASNNPGAGDVVYLTNATNNYTGATLVTFNGASLRMGVANALPAATALTVSSGAFLDLNGFNTTIGSLAGTGTVANGSVTAATLTAGGNNGNSTFSGVIQNSSGAVSLTKAGSGTLTLSGANTNSGTTTINAGKLTVLNASTTSNAGTLGSGSVTVSAGAVLEFNNSRTLNDGYNINNTISGAGSLLFSGPDGAVTTLGAANSYSGGTTIQSGVVNVNQGDGAGNTSVFGTGTVTMTGGAIRATNGGKTITNALTLSGTVGFGASTSLSGAVSLAGNTTVTASLNFGGSTWSGSLGLGSYTLATAITGPNSSGGSWSTGYGLTLSGAVTGTGGLTHAATGDLILTGANTYSGITTISAGKLYVGIGGTAGALGTGGVTNNAALIFNRSDALTVSGAISGTGTLTQNGTGTLTVTGANTYSGTTTIGAGTLQVGAGGTTGSLGTSTVSNSAALVFNRSDTITLGTAVSGAGSLTQSGTGTLILGGINTYSGTTTISAGTLQVGTGSTTGNVGSGAVTNNAALVFNRSNALTVSSAISGTGTLTQSGAGITTLTGANTYTGATTVNSGQLVAGSISAFGSASGVTVASGAVMDLAGFSNSIGTLQGTGTVTNNGANATLTFTNIGGGNYTVPTLLTDGSGILSIYLTSSGRLVFSNQNRFTGSLTGSNGQFGVSGTGSLNSGNYAGTITRPFFYSSSADQILSGSLGGISLIKDTSAASILTLSGNNSFISPTINAGTLRLGSANALGSSGSITFGGGTLQYGASNQTDYSSRFSTAASQPISVDTNGQTITFASALTSSGGSLSKLGTGSLILTGANTYSGTTTVSAGTLALAPATTATIGSVNVTGGATGAILSVTTGTTTLNGDLTLAVAGSDVNAQAQFIGGNLTASRLWVGNASGASGSVTQSAGTVALVSAADPGLALGFAAGSTGSYSISGGTLNVTGITNVGRGGTGTFTQTGGTVNASNYFSGARLSGSTGTMNFSGGAMNVLGGSLMAAEVGTGTINVSGTALVTLTNTLAFGACCAVSGTSGTVNLNGGTIVAPSVSTPGAGTSTFNFNGGTLRSSAASTTFLQGLTSTNLLSSGGTIDSNGFAVTVGQALSGSGALTKAGTGTLTLSGTNSYTGTTTISAGTLRAGSTSALGSNTAMTVASGATLDLFGNSLAIGSLAGAGTVTNSSSAGAILTSGGLNATTSFSGRINDGTGSVGLTLGGSGSILNLSGASTFTGALQINQGATLNLLAGASLATGAVNIGQAGAPSGYATLTNSADNQLTNAVVTFTGASGKWAYWQLGNTTQSALGINDASGSGVVETTENTSNATATLNLTGGGSYSYNGYLRSTSGGSNVVLNLTKSGSGTQVLSDSNIRHTGTTTISGGTLRLLDTVYFASAATVDAGATLSLGRSANGLANRSRVSSTIGGAGTLSIDNPTSGIGGGWVSFVSGAGLTAGFTGNVAINSGVLTMDGVSGLWAATPAVSIASGGLLGLRGQSLTLASLTGTGDVFNSWNGNGAQTLTITNPAASTFDGVIHGSIASGGTDGSIEQGVVNLVKAGTDTLTLTGANTYTGSTTVNAGTLTLGGSGSLGTGDYAGAVTLSGGNLSFNTATAQRLSGTLTLGSNAALTNSAASLLTISGSIGLGSRTLTLLGNGTAAGNGTPYGGATANMLISGVIGGTGALQVGNTTAVNLTLSGTNTFTGAVTVGCGGCNSTPASILTLTNSAALGAGSKIVTSQGGGEIHLQNSITLPGSISFTTAGSTLQNNLAGQNGVLVSDSGSNVINGAITVSSGQGTSSFYAAAGSTLTLNGGIAANLSSRTLQLDGPGSIVVNGAIADGTNPLALAVGSLSKTATGTVTLNGTNTFTGTTTVAGGTLVIGGSGSLGAGDYAGGVTLSGGNLSFNTATAQRLSGAVTLSSNGTLTNSAASLLTISGSVGLGTRTLTLLGNGTGTGNGTPYGGATANMLISGAIGGTGALQVGNATAVNLTLSGTNTFTGAVTVGCGGCNTSPASVLTLTNSAALGTGPTLVRAQSGGEIHLQNSIRLPASISLALSGSIFQNGVNTKNGVITADSGNNVIDGAITISGGAGLSSIQAAAGSSLTLNGAIAADVANRSINLDGAGSITVNGAISDGTNPLALVVGSVTGAATGTMTLTGANTFTGATTVSGGTLNLGGSWNVGAGVATTAVASGATLTGTGTVTAGTLAHSGGGMLSLTGSNAIGLFQATGTTGTVRLNNAQSLTTGSIQATGAIALTTTPGSGASLTLAPGALLTSAASGTAITLAADRSFINNAGAGALAAANGRWLVYVAAPTGNTFGGLNSGNRAVWSTANGAAVSATGNRYVFAFQPTVTFAVPSANKSYGTDASSSVASNYSVSGIQPGVAGAYQADTAGDAFSGSPLVSSPGAAAGATVGGGPYAITLAPGTVTPINGYAVAYGTSGTLTATPAPLTITGATTRTTYNGSAQTNSYAITSGQLFGNDTLSAVAGLAAGTNAGTYGDALSGATGSGLGNYAISYVNGSLVIDRALLTLIGANTVVTYNGLAQVNAGAVLAGEQGTDRFTITGYAGGIAAGTYSDSLQLTGSAGSLLSNYELAIVQGGLVISPALLTITGATTRTTYKGAPQANTFAITTGQLFGSDTLTGVTGLASGTNVGTYADTLSAATGRGLENYAISYANGSLAIDRALLTLVYTADAATSVYGSAMAPLSGVVAGRGFVGSDGVSSLLGQAAWASDARAAAGTYGITGSGLFSPNYEITALQAATNSGAYRVQPASLRITANDATVFYSGTAWSGGNGLGFDGLVNGDTPTDIRGSLTWAGSAQGATAVGSYELAAKGLLSPNYVITWLPGTLSILTPAAQDQAPTLVVQRETLRRSGSAITNCDLSVSNRTQPVTASCSAVAGAGF